MVHMGASHGHSRLHFNHCDHVELSRGGVLIVSLALAISISLVRHVVRHL